MSSSSSRPAGSPVCSSTSADGLDQAAATELQRREIDRHRRRRQPGRQPGRDLAAGGLEHPAADGHDQAAILGHRNEAGRRHLADFGIVPAQQRLEAGDAAAIDVELGLVGEAEFRAAQRLVQAILQQQVFAHLVVHRLVEEAIGVAAGRLGRVHRGIGPLQQGVEVLAVVRVEGDADAAARGDGVAVDEDGLGQAQQDLAGDALRRGRVGNVVEQDDELVAALPAHGVGVAHALRRGATPRP